MSTQPHSSTVLPADCPNCGAQLRGRFCAACGQDCGNLRLDSRALLREGMGQILGWDGALLRTMRGLWQKPGELALDYVGGRRKSYLHPARFCFISLALWMVALKLAGINVLEAAGLEFDAGGGDARETAAKIRAFLSRHFDWLIFLALPLRGYFFQRAFRRSKRTVGACLVPVLYVNGFGFLIGVLLVGVGAIVSEDALRIRPLISMIWTIRTMRAFFGVGWVEATLKSILVLAVHVLATVVSVGLLVLLWIYLGG